MTRPLSPSGRRLPGTGLLAGGAAAGAVAAGALTAAVRAGATAGADERVGAAAVAAGRVAPVEGWARVQWFIGSPVVLTLLSSAVVVALFLARRRGYAGYLAATALGGVVLVSLVKNTVERPRPQWPDPLATASGFSYPSGHATAGVTNWVVYGVIVLLLVPGRRGVAGAAALMAVGLLMAPSRLALGVHWPTDVLAGWLIGGAWVLAVSAMAVHRLTARAEPPAAPA